MPDQYNNQNDQDTAGTQNEFENTGSDRVDRQRDMGSGLNAGTDVGRYGGTDPYPGPGETTPTGPGADPHSGTGNGEYVGTGQYRGSDEGTTTGDYLADNTKKGPDMHLGSNIGTGDYAHEGAGNDLGTDQYTNSGGGWVANTDTTGGGFEGESNQ